MARSHPTWCCSGDWSAVVAHECPLHLAWTALSFQPAGCTWTPLTLLHFFLGCEHIYRACDCGCTSIKSQRPLAMSFPQHRATVTAAATSSSSSWMCFQCLFLKIIRNTSLLLNSTAGRQTMGFVAAPLCKLSALSSGCLWALPDLSTGHSTQHHHCLSGKPLSGGKEATYMCSQLLRECFSEAHQGLSHLGRSGVLIQCLSAQGGHMCMCA